MAVSIVCTTEALEIKGRTSVINIHVHCNGVALGISSDIYCAPVVVLPSNCNLYH